jgi:glycosyltransferase involved in cell wall biosynthesis
VVSGDERISVIATLEQLWHPVPGGTARAALGLLDELLKVPQLDLTAYAAAHRSAPPAEWQGPAGLQWKHSMLPRAALYESWVRLGHPRVGRKHEIVHSTTLVPVPTGGRSIVTIHDLNFLDDPSTSSRRGRGFFRRCADVARAKADIVLGPSVATREAATRHGFAGDRLRLVPLAAEAPLAVAATERDKPYVLWVGTHEPRKNLAGLIDAFRLVAPEVPHDLMIVGPRGWGSDIDSHLTGIRDRVHLHGFASPAELASLYLGADAFVFPSFAEGFGLPVLEAMSYGVPVITSAGTSTAELVADGAGIAVDPFDSSSIAAALASLLHDPERRAILSAAGRSRASTYTWAKSAEAIVAVYRELLA